MKTLLTQLFTWWNGQTLGTRFFTWRKGRKVGEDELGNVYYQTDGGERRWVIYNGLADASRVPAAWHGWMHYTVDTPPTEIDYKRREWEKDHLQNLTGTPAAYRPRGSILTPERRPRVTGDYDAWTPE